MSIKEIELASIGDIDPIELRVTPEIKKSNNM